MVAIDLGKWGCTDSQVEILRLALPAGLPPDMQSLRLQNTFRLAAVSQQVMNASQI